MKCFSILLLLVVCVIGNAQSYNIHYFYADSSVIHSLKLRSSFASRSESGKYITELPGTLLVKGYLAASIDSVQYDSVQAKLWLYTGTKYRWGHIEIPSTYQPVLNRINNNKPLTGKVIAGNQLEDWRIKLLDYFAANGHPFASVGLDSVTVSGDSLSGKMTINEGPVYKIDSIHLIGKVKLKPNFIYPYLHLEKGMLYHQPLLDKIDQRLNELPFAEQVQPWSLDMLGSGSIVNIYLQPKRSNIINALLGLMPASTQTPNNKLQITGEANILLRNAFAMGESIGINWQQIQYKSPRLNLSYSQPYLFGSQAGAELFFELFKKDTQYVNINFRIGIPYEFSVARSAKVFFQQLSTNVTYTDTNVVKASRRLPDVADVSSSNLGLEYTWNTTDYRLNPRRGIEVFISGTGGLKKIKKNSSVVGLKDPLDPSFNFDSLYDTVKLKTYQLRLKGTAAKYLSLAKQSVVKLAVNGGWYQSQNYYRNELFQIGGYRLLRGFDEESIFARGYLTGTAEFRYLSGRNSYFFAFADGGYASYKDEVQEYGHSYIGGGLGLALETKNSVINLSWAVGKRNDLPFDFRQSKIHLGFINFF